MAKIVGGFGISHTPSMGIEYDKGIANGFSPHWQPWFDGTRPVKKWLEELKPERMVIVYNDHLNHFDFDAYPTIAIGVAPEFRQADEGWGPRPFPSLTGDVELGWHLTNRLVRGGYDLTVCQDLAVDHGIYSWFPYLMDTPWDIPIVPIAINMVRHPIPTSQRLYNFGKAIREAVENFPGDHRTIIVSTGGMSHQISGARFGIANEDQGRRAGAGRHASGGVHAAGRHGSFRARHLVLDARVAVGRHPGNLPLLHLPGDHRLRRDRVRGEGIEEFRFA
jgi:protocatechuate 4,5-dioxygenase, beta chain